VEVDGMQTLHRFLIVPDTKINVNIEFDFLKKFTVVLENGKYTFKRGDDTVAENDHNIYNCEELNNSPQIEAAADGRPLTRYAANSRSNGTARRVWRLGWRTKEFGDQ